MSGPEQKGGGFWTFVLLLWLVAALVWAFKR